LRCGCVEYIRLREVNLAQRLRELRSTDPDAVVLQLIPVVVALIARMLLVRVRGTGSGRQSTQNLFICRVLGATGLGPDRAADFA
jgi:hypothetical protein